MSEIEASQLRVGSRVSVLDFAGIDRQRTRVYGTIVEAGHDFCRIAWDRADMGARIRSTRWLRDMDDFEAAENPLAESDVERLAMNAEG